YCVRFFPAFGRAEKIDRKVVRGH
ncbi:unnamed protein product, partial [Allacma fusca]